MPSKNTANTSTQPFFLGEILVVPEQNKLSANSEESFIQPKVMAVLCYLAKHHDRVVSKEELLDALWEGQVVSIGSVQKSINSLRKALADYLDNRDVIKNYSKKGYQILMEPKQIGAQEEPTPKINASNATSFQITRAQRLYFFSSLAVAILLASFFTLSRQKAPSVHKSHKTVFTTRSGFTNETGHERGALPHPNNSHVVFIRDLFDPADLSLTESQLWLKPVGREKWKIQSSSNSWFKLAWSPAGKQLLAVEVLRKGGKPLTPEFHQNPDYFYNIHVLDIDLEKKEVVNEQLVTQWQGRLLSINWWDENTIELLARQGSNSNNQRYRFSLASKNMTLIPSPFSGVTPLKSAIHNKQTLLTVSDNENHIHLYFLDEAQRIKHRYKSPYKSINATWIPDNSGALVLGDQKNLQNIYIDGSTEVIPIDNQVENYTYWPRYSDDGQSIYFTEKSFRSNIFEFTSSGKLNLSNNQGLNQQPKYSNSLKKIAYLSSRNNQMQLWVIEDGREFKVDTSELAQSSYPLWSLDDTHIVFKSEGALYSYNLEGDEQKTLLNEATNSDPIAYDSQKNILIVKKFNQSTYNLWEINLTSTERRQLTFGAIGSAYVDASRNVYFQYSGKMGIWLINAEHEKPFLVSETVPENIKLLHVSQEKAYYLEGGRCRESHVTEFDLKNGNTSTYLERPTEVISTSSFHPEAGSLGWYCYLPESNIIRLN